MRRLSRQRINQARQRIDWIDRVIQEDGTQTHQSLFGQVGRLLQTENQANTGRRLPQEVLAVSDLEVCFVAEHDRRFGKCQVAIDISAGVDAKSRVQCELVDWENTRTRLQIVGIAQGKRDSLIGRFAELNADLVGPQPECFTNTSLLAFGDLVQEAVAGQILVKDAVEVVGDLGDAVGRVRAKRVVNMLHQAASNFGNVDVTWIVVTAGQFDREGLWVDRFA